MQRQERRAVTGKLLPATTTNPATRLLLALSLFPLSFLLAHFVPHSLSLSLFILLLLFFKFSSGVGCTFFIQSLCICSCWLCAPCSSSAYPRTTGSAGLLHLSLVQSPVLCMGAARPGPAPWSCTAWKMLLSLGGTGKCRDGFTGPFVGADSLHCRFGRACL